MRNTISEEMTRVKVDEMLEDMVQNLIENSREWNRGLSREDIVKIIIEQSLDIPFIEPEIGE